MYHIANLVSANGDPPAKVFNGVICTRTSGVTFALEGITGNGTTRIGRVAGTHVDWVSSVSKVVDTSVGTVLVIANVIAWRSRESKPACSQSIGKRLKGDGWQAKSKAKERSNDTAEGVASQPDVGVGVELSDVVVEVLSSMVVVGLVSQSFHQTGRVAGVGRRLAITDVLPCQLTTLTAAAAPEQVVVKLVVAGRIRAIKNGGRCSFEPNDDSLVLGVGKDVASQAIALPAKIFSVVEASTNFNPVAGVWLDDIGIRSHASERHDRLLVSNVWTVYVIYSPGRGRQRNSLSTHLAGFE